MDPNVVRPTVALETLGCKLNQADTDLLTDAFRGAGFSISREPDCADVVVLNTCTVTHGADRKARKRLRSMRRANPEAMIVATGCYAERVSEEIRAAGVADVVLGNRGKRELVGHVARTIFGSGIDRPSWIGRSGAGESGGAAGDSFVESNAKTRAFVKIQEGCRYACAFCIVPRVRGRARSVDAGDVLNLIKQRLAEGYREIVLTGTEVGDYGLKDGSLALLIARILDETSVARLRISSLQPQEIDAEILEHWRDPRLCPHFHIALQSGSDNVLDAMRRPFNVAQFLEAVELVRRHVPNAGITTDVIAGFPGETEEDFTATLEVCRQARVSAIHAFPFSPRRGTAAARMAGQVGSDAINNRMKRLLAAAEQRSIEFREKQAGTRAQILWESVSTVEGESRMTGLTGNYVKVYSAKLNARGAVTSATLSGLVADGVAAI